MYEMLKQPLGYWDTSGVPAIDWMFMEDYTFNQPIGHWASGATSMYEMFNRPIGYLDTSGATAMYWMLMENSTFNQLSGIAMPPAQRRCTRRIQLEKLFQVVAHATQAALYR